MNYNLIVVGGGVAGSSLASMAASGMRVLVLERETQFHDRIRGEALQPWGVSEARKLGIARMLEQVAAELRWFDQILNGERVMREILRFLSAN